MVREERAYCYRCVRPKKACFCGELPSIKTKAKFVFLMHPLEIKKSHVGTGRLAHLALENSEIIVGVNFDQEARYQNLLGDSQYAPMVLYPGEQSLNLSKEKLATHLPTGKTPLIFLIDGTWPCAKKMMKLTKSLQHLPRVSFSSDQTSKFTMKQQPAKFCLSTIESVHIVLDALHRQEFETIGPELDQLLVPLQKTSEFHIKCANDPTMNNYQRESARSRQPEIRKSAKKWESRSICFQG